MAPGYWLRRLFKAGYTYKGKPCQARAWSVKIQHRGRRKTFPLLSSRRQQAAVEACHIYRTIVTQSWEKALTRHDRQIATAASLSGQGLALDSNHSELAFWAQRLITREYTMSFGSKPARELSAHVEHQGTKHYFPLGTDDPKLAANRALQIYQVVAGQGWRAACERFRRELTVAFRWLDNPLAWTYTTIHTQTLPRRPFSVEAAASGRLRVVVAESDGGVRQALAQCLNHMGGFYCIGAFATTGEALREVRREPGSLVLINRSLADKPGTAGAEELRSAAPGVAGLFYSVYEDSEELFRATPGGAGTYLLRRTPPTGFLKPIEGLLAKGSFSTEEMTAGAWQYFKETLASLPIGAPAQQFMHLTPREHEVLALLSKGQLHKEIADWLGISIYTVHEHVRNIFEKLGAHNRTEAVVKFLQK